MTKTIPALLAALIICSSQPVLAEYAYSYTNSIPATDYLFLGGTIYETPTVVDRSWSVLFSNQLSPNTVYGLSDVLAYNFDYVDNSSYSTFMSKELPGPGGVLSFYIRTNETGQIDDWNINYNLCGCQQTYITSTALDSVFRGWGIGYTEGSTAQTSTWSETYLAAPFANGTPPPITAVAEPETYAMLLAGLGLVGFASRRNQS